MLESGSYIFKHTLKDGTQVTLRGARADDGPKIRQAFSKLMGETIYTRFFTNKAEISDTDLERVTGADFDRTVALLATIGSGDEEIVIGGASYVVLDADLPDRSAEMAFTVEEDYQRLGVASLLMRHIVRSRARPAWPACRRKCSRATLRCWPSSGAAACRWPPGSREGWCMRGCRWTRTPGPPRTTGIRVVPDEALAHRGGA